MTGARLIVFVAVLILTLIMNAQSPPNRIAQVLLHHKLCLALYLKRRILPIA